MNQLVPKPVRRETLLKAILTALAAGNGGKPAPVETLFAQQLVPRRATDERHAMN